jgi:hypothetical protein
MDATTGDPGLQAAIAALADPSAEARRLAMPTLLDAWRRAGEPASAAEERIASPAAARVLSEILARSGRPEPLPEWISLATQAGVAVPYDLLPELIHTGARVMDMREMVAGALGPCGRWLATLNPAWSYAAKPPATPGTWGTATAQQRLGILREMRRSDPAAGLALVRSTWAAGLALVRSTWAADPPGVRMALLGGLSVGLGMADEPFVESALDDEHKEVRAAGARLLATLPGSRLVGRMTKRLAPLLWPRGRGGLLDRLRGVRLRVDVKLPAACDRGMRRDGIQPNPPHGTGERAWWLQQMLASVPPSVWTVRWGMDAAACLSAARASGHGALLVRGWAEAAILSRDADWAETLLRAEAGTDWLNAIKGLAAALPPDRLERLVLERMRDTGRQAEDEDDFTLQMLDMARAWSPALTRAVLAALPAPPLPRWSGIRSRLGRYALHMHPATAVAIAGLRERDPGEGEWLDLIHLRHAMHQAFS